MIARRVPPPKPAAPAPLVAWESIRPPSVAVQKVEPGAQLVLSRQESLHWP